MSQNSSKMNMNTNCNADSLTSLRISENKSSHKSKESIKKPIKVKELYHRDINKSILKLCSEADLRIKVLLSNTGSGAISSSSKFSSKETLSPHDSSAKQTSVCTSPKLSSLGTTPKTISLAELKHNIRRSSTQKCPYRDDTNSSCHFNTEIDNIDDPTNKQLTVHKVLKLIDLARRMEKRQKALIQNEFESTSFERSYVDGLEEGLRYGYFNNPNEQLRAENEKAIKTEITNEKDQVSMKKSEVVQPEVKDSKRMRGGFQDPQQQEIHLKNTIEQKNSTPLDKIDKTDKIDKIDKIDKTDKTDKIDKIDKTDTKESITQAKILKELKPSGITITNEYPTKCDENVNVEAFNRKYKISNTKLKHPRENIVSVKKLNIDRGDQYLQYFEKMLSSLGEDFAIGFRAGFGDGFMAANIFVSNDNTFADDERNYINQMRKCLKYSDVNLDDDIKKITARAVEMQKSLNIPVDEFEEISFLVRKGMVKKVPLKFSKNDFKHYVDASKRDRDNIKIKSSYEDESDIMFASYEEARDIPQHTKNRAKRYLLKHKINEFFQYLGSHLVATKPDDPITFLINLLDKCIEYRFNEYVVQAPLLFTKKHVESVYFVLDPMSTGFIDLSQYIHGMEALGLRDLEDLTNFRSGEKIDKHIFVTNACRRLLWKFRAMIALDSVIVHHSSAFEAR